MLNNGAVVTHREAGDVDMLSMLDAELEADGKALQGDLEDANTDLASKYRQFRQEQQEVDRPSVG